MAIICERFPNTRIYSGARKIGRGAMAGAYRATVRTVESSAWSRPCVSRFASAAAFSCKSDAIAAAETAAREAARTGYVPAF